MFSYENPVEHNPAHSATTNDVYPRAVISGMYTACPFHLCHLRYHVELEPPKFQATPPQPCSNASSSTESLANLLRLGGPLLPTVEESRSNSPKRRELQHKCSNPVV